MKKIILAFLVLGFSSAAQAVTYTINQGSQTLSGRNTFKGQTIFQGSVSISSITITTEAVNTLSVSSLNITGQLSANGNAGTAGQFLASNGPGSAPTWTNGSSTSTVATTTFTFTGTNNFNGPSGSEKSILTVSTGTNNLFEVTGDSVVIRAKFASMMSKFVGPNLVGAYFVHYGTGSVTPLMVNVSSVNQTAPGIYTLNFPPGTWLCPECYVCFIMPSNVATVQFNVANRMDNSQFTKTATQYGFRTGGTNGTELRVPQVEGACVGIPPPQ